MMSCSLEVLSLSVSFLAPAPEGWDKDINNNNRNLIKLTQDHLATRSALYSILPQASHLTSDILSTGKVLVGQLGLVSPASLSLAPGPGGLG